MSHPRIPPLPEPEWDPAVSELLAPWRLETPAGSYVPNIFTTFARNPLLLSAWEPFAGEILLHGTLPARDRELLVLRTAWNCRASYIWSSHAGGHGPEAGLREAEIARVTEGPQAPGWSNWEATLLRAADELHAAATIEDATWELLAERYNEAQLVELPMLVGQYHLMAFTLNSLRVQDEAGASGLPAGRAQPQPPRPAAAVQ